MPALLRYRFIPASAGNTCKGGRGRPGPPVHPRERGEHEPTMNAPESNAGSSPRARGTPSPERRAGSPPRFIPASAGNTREQPAVRMKAAVHPRERGEHFGMPIVRLRVNGSSPRARGTLFEVEREHDVTRFIPASAGNTAPPPRSSTTRAVHPRERGEHRPYWRQISSSRGSSPRARGTRVVKQPEDRRTRFIPASAGNTCPAPRTTRVRSVHPRERGEHTSANAAMCCGYGSSPRARGTPGAALQYQAVHRFIPASAGNTSAASASAAPSAVHPRERGEHATAASTMLSLPGSSPRARGTRPPRGAVFLALRFIPASAGNTSQLTP